MDCLNVQATLSPYHDGELTAHARETLELHLGCCDECFAALRDFRRLSRLVSLMSQPNPPTELWQQIQHDLDQKTVPPLLEKPNRRQATAVRLALAALIVIAFGMGFYLSSWDSDEMHHDHLAVFWKTFESDPAHAQMKLVRQYRGRVITEEEAQGQVGYSPLKAHQLPEGLLVQTRYVLDMPCCRCVQTICQRPDGTVLAVFEHNKPEPHWFQGQPKIRIHSAGTLCQVTELKKTLLAASWEFEQRTITVVGMKTAEELVDWEQRLATVFPKRTRASPHRKLTFDSTVPTRFSPSAHDDPLRLFDISTVQSRGEGRLIT